MRPSAPGGTGGQSLPGAGTSASGHLAPAAGGRAGKAPGPAGSPDVLPDVVLDVVVLAGGTGRRLGGASKPDVLARGARLLDHVLRGLEHLRHDGVVLGAVCVVAPEPVALPAGVLRALEDPPLGGPVAGIAAGLARLRRAQRREVCASPLQDGPAPLTAVLACDAPRGWQALPELLDALTDGPADREAADGASAGTTGPDNSGTDSVTQEASRAREGACVLHDGHLQYLLGVYRTHALERAAAPGGVALRDTAVRRALAGLDVLAVSLRHPEAARDLDTWEDVRAWDLHAGDGTLPPTEPPPRPRTDGI